jgi:hypothetical protein
MVELERRVQANDVMLEASRQEVSVLRQREEARDAFWPQLVGYGVGLERRECGSRCRGGVGFHHG